MRELMSSLLQCWCSFSTVWSHTWKFYELRYSALQKLFPRYQIKRQQWMIWKSSALPECFSVDVAWTNCLEWYATWFASDDEYSDISLDCTGAHHRLHFLSALEWVIWVIIRFTLKNKFGTFWVDCAELRCLTAHSRMIYILANLVHYLTVIEWDVYSIIFHIQS